MNTQVIKLEKIPELLQAINSYIEALDNIEACFAETDPRKSVDERYLEMVLAQAELKLRKCFEAVK